MPDRIQLPDRSSFHSSGALYATWAHEVIHSTGHCSRLARDLSGGMGEGGDGGRACSREELVAELGAVLLGDRLEIGSAMANHAAYQGHWVELLKESPQVLLQVLSDARPRIWSARRGRASSKKPISNAAPPDGRSETPPAPG